MACKHRRLAIAFASVISLISGAHASQDELVKLYFGVGCFWHVQHEFIKAEQTVLGRSGGELTAISGYAGGTKKNTAGKVCYYDYGRNGHTEVVEVSIPLSKVPAFAEVFWGLFVGKDRVDTMDVGPGYRAALGLPNGTESVLLSQVNASQKGRVAQPFSLEKGAGDDGDTLGVPLVWVYDSNEFPFFQAEMYHQFHDDFMPGGQYPQTYNDLINDVYKACRLQPTGCPNDLEPPLTKCADSLPQGTFKQRNESTTYKPGGSGKGFDDEDETPTTSNTAISRAKSQGLVALNCVICFVASLVGR